MHVRSWIERKLKLCDLRVAFWLRMFGVPLHKTLCFGLSLCFKDSFKARLEATSKFQSQTLCPTCLRGCSLTERSAEALQPLIAKGHLTNLNLNGNDLGDDGILKVCIYL